MKFHTNIISIVVSLFASVGFCSSTIDKTISLPSSSTASAGYDDSGAAWAFSPGASSITGHNAAILNWNYVGANSGQREVFWSFDLGSGSYDLISASLDFYTNSIDADTTLYVDYYFSDSAPFTVSAADSTIFDWPDADYLRSDGASILDDWATGGGGETFTNVAAGIRNIVFDVSSHVDGDQYLTIRFSKTGGSGTVNLARVKNAGGIPNNDDVIPELSYTYTTVPELRATSLFVGIIVLGWIVCSRRRAVRTAC